MTEPNVLLSRSDQDSEEPPLPEHYGTVVSEKDWKDAEPLDLEPFYSHWVNELTAQGLHAKADIATVLAILSRRISMCREDELRRIAVSERERILADDVLGQVEAALRKNPLIAMFLEQKFWHAHHVDMVVRYNGEDRRYEADWIKDIWYTVLRRGRSQEAWWRAQGLDPAGATAGTSAGGNLNAEQGSGDGR